MCSRHFVSGRAALYREETNVDWVPTLNLGHNKMDGDTDNVQAARSARNERPKARRNRQHEKALLESAAKVAKLNEECDSIGNTAFDASLTLETTDTP